MTRYRPVRVLLAALASYPGAVAIFALLIPGATWRVSAAYVAVGGIIGVGTWVYARVLCALWRWAR